MILSSVVFSVGKQGKIYTESLSCEEYIWINSLAAVMESKTHALALSAVSLHSLLRPFALPARVSAS